MPRVLHYAPLIASIAWFRSPSFAGKLPLFAWLKWNIHEYTPFSDISKSHFCLLSSPFPPPFQLAQAHRRTRSKSALSPGIRQSSGWWFGSPLKQNRQVNYSSSWTFSEKKTFKQKQTPFKILPWKTNYVKPMEKKTPTSFNTPRTKQVPRFPGSTSPFPWHSVGTWSSPLWSLPALDAILQLRSTGSMGFHKWRHPKMDALHSLQWIIPSINRTMENPIYVFLDDLRVATF